jgi:hypothetical protein
MCYGENGTVTGYLNYHSESGSINVNESLQKCRKKLREFRQICIKRGIFKDTHFVGREKDNIVEIHIIRYVCCMLILEVPQTSSIKPNVKI